MKPTLKVTFSTKTKLSIKKEQLETWFNQCLEVLILNAEQDLQPTLVISEKYQLEFLLNKHQEDIINISEIFLEDLGVSIPACSDCLLNLNKSYE